MKDLKMKEILPLNFFRIFFEDKRLQKYAILSNGQNSCYGNSITGLVSAVPEEKELSPYYYYNFRDGELSFTLKMEKNYQFQNVIAII